MVTNQVINYLLDTKDTSLIVLNNLTDKYFPDYKKEFNFILNHFKQYGNRKILVSPTEKIIETIPENESIKDTFIRLGWIDRDGKIL